MRGVKKADVLKRLQTGQMICVRERFVDNTARRATYLTPEVGREYGEDIHGATFSSLARQLQVSKKFLNGQETTPGPVTVQDGDTVETYYELKR